MVVGIVTAVPNAPPRRSMTTVARIATNPAIMAERTTVETPETMEAPYPRNASMWTTCSISILVAP